MKKIKHLDRNQYQPMEYSKIFLSMSSFLNLQNKFVTQENKNEKKNKKNKILMKTKQVFILKII